MYSIFLFVIFLIAFVNGRLEVKEHKGLLEAEDRTRLLSKYKTIINRDRVKNNLKRIEENAAMDCEMCKNIVKAVLAVSVIQDLNFSKDVLRKECKQLFKKDEAIRVVCVLAVDVIYRIISLINELKNDNWDIPLNVCSLIFNKCYEPCCETSYTPEQILINLPSSDLSQMRVTWVTLRITEFPYVNYYPTANPDQILTARATNDTYTYDNWVGIIYTAVMTGLSSGTNYTYNVGSDNYTRSKNYTFKTFPKNIGTPERPLRIVQIGDMGYSSASDSSVKTLTEQVSKGNIDLIIHNGDIVYHNGQLNHWDNYMRKIEPISAHVPYMTTPGNHEFWYDFMPYNYRMGYKMPKPDSDQPLNSMYYQFKVGPVHFLMMSTESPFDDLEMSFEQISWTKKVLSNVNRTDTPWVIVNHHRPLYCNKLDSDECNSEAISIRKWIEDIYIEGKVDLVNTAHVHYYLRSFPISRGKITNMSYDNPQAPVYVVNGAAGNHEGQESLGPSSLLYPFGSIDYGYSFCTISSDVADNNHSLMYEFFSSEKNKVIDAFKIIKTN